MFYEDIGKPWNVTHWVFVIVMLKMMVQYIKIRLFGK